MTHDAVVPANVDRFSGFAAHYDTMRPQAPAILRDVLSQLAGVQRPVLVVDVGSGTGLSTTFWHDYAERIIGVEPNDDMRAQAVVRATNEGASNVKFRAGTSSATGLPDACADIVTVSQALHWMDPEPTFAEVARILRPGGVFAAYDCDTPPTINARVERAYMEFAEHSGRLQIEHGTSREVRRWAKTDHYERIVHSGRFRYTREIAVHSVEQGDVNRLIGYALSQGGIQTMLRQGVDIALLNVDVLRQIATEELGTQTVPWYWTYRVRIGIR